MSNILFEKEMHSGDAFAQSLAQDLHLRGQLNRYRQRRVLGSAQGPRVVVDGQQLINFCSNDYLGLANHADLIHAMQNCAASTGVGGGASHLVCGHTHEHHALEEELAVFTGRSRALLFSTGYMANIGLIQALLGRGDAIFQDKLNHASLIDGAQLSRAKLHRYAHGNVSQLNLQLEKSSGRRKLIATDSVFSMDGDIAPLTELARIAKNHHAWLMVDDAHGLGCLGLHGGGVQEQMTLSQEQLPILMGTLGKSFGSFGAFVAGNELLIESLIQFARSYVYTTSMPPAVAAATRASLKIVKTETWRRDKLNALIKYFRDACDAENIPLMPSTTPIQPVQVGEESKALALSAELMAAGFWVSAIRPPTVPEGSSRLRVTLTASHEQDDVARLVDALACGLKRNGVAQ